MADEASATKSEVKNKEDQNPRSDRRSSSGGNSNRPQQRRPYQRRGGGGYRGRGGYRRHRKVCNFCADRIKVINWKQADQLRRFINDGGGMRSRRKTGTCARHQRRLAIAIKRARHMAMLPYTVEHVRVMSKSR